MSNQCDEEEWAYEDAEKANERYDAKLLDDLSFDIPMRGAGMDRIYTAGSSSHQWTIQVSDHKLPQNDYSTSVARTSWQDALCNGAKVASQEEIKGFRGRLSEKGVTDWCYQEFVVSSWGKTESIGVSYVNEGSHAMSFTGIKTEFWQLNFDHGQGKLKSGQQRTTNQGYNEMRGWQLRDDIKSKFFGDVNMSLLTMDRRQVRRHLVVPFCFCEGLGTIPNLKNIVGLMNLDLSAILWSTGNEKYVPVVEVAVFEYLPEKNSIKFWDSYIDLFSKRTMDVEMDKWSEEDVKCWLKIHEFDHAKLHEANFNGEQFRSTFFDNRNRIDEYSDRYGMSPEQIAELVMLVGRAILHSTAMYDNWKHNMSFQQIRHYGVCMASNRIRIKTCLRDFMMSSAQLFVEQFLIREIRSGEDPDVPASVPKTFLHPHQHNAALNLLPQPQPPPASATKRARDDNTIESNPRGLPSPKRSRRDIEEAEEVTSSEDSEESEEEKEGALTEEQIKAYRESVRFKLSQFELSNPRKFLFVFYPRLYGRGKFPKTQYRLMLEKCMKQTLGKIKGDTTLTPRQTIDHEEILSMLHKFVAQLAVAQ